MGGNVVLSLRSLADDSCVGDVRRGPHGDALAGRDWRSPSSPSGWPACSVPVFSPPAANAWLLSTPVDRGALLRPGWLRTVAAHARAAPPWCWSCRRCSAASPGTQAVAFVVAGSATALACVGDRRPLPGPREPRSRAGSPGWSPASLWVGARASPRPRSSDASPPAARPRRGARRARRPGRRRGSGGGPASRSAVVPRRVLGYTEHLSPSLSGALSSLDLGLMYDVLLARRWGRGAHVRSRTGGPLGWWALVHRDLLRALRAPQPYVLLAGLVLLPYAAAEAGAGRAVVLATTLAGLLGGPPLCAGLRVVVRTRAAWRGCCRCDASRCCSPTWSCPGAALMALRPGDDCDARCRCAARDRGQPRDRVRAVVDGGDGAVGDGQAARTTRRRW